MKINQLTFLRFVAAVIVVIFHYGDNTWFTRMSPALQAGPPMVTFFFVLSGFIMAIAYGQRGELEKGRYWVARFARIAPMYYLALILTVIAIGQKPNSMDLILQGSFLHAWFPQHVRGLNNPSWAVSVEMFFYLIFPYLLSFINREFSVPKAIVLAVIFWGASMIVLGDLRNYYNLQDPRDPALQAIITYFPLSHLSSFVLGMVGGLAYMHYLSQMRISSLLSASLVIFAFGMVAAILHYHTKIRILAKLNFSYGLLSLLFLLLILTLAIDRSFLSGILSNKILVFLGELGYSIYILQNPAHRLYEKYVTPIILLTSADHFYLYLLLLIVISVGAYLLIEKPMRYKLRLLADHYLFNLKAEIPEHAS